MIHHLSIAARDPKHVAEVLAECMEGIAIPFPPNPGSFFALALDSHGTGVEVYPAGTVLQPDGLAGGAFVKEAPRDKSYVPTHFAMSVALEADQIEAVARREGWACFTCVRGGGFFRVVELWLEDTVMVELLPPAFAKEYLDFAKAENVEKFMNAAGAPRH